ncbi:unnamed protein product [Acanthoscelides obtectus]|uniref:Uncharacterized protein n=1 Tax=Acanthoscelides obtectus TaxID=200917 RepID=A0A9P0JZ19_ACAOB|nr:unnamed protein product [Acanthoscelides obtectus]CAK1639120.1 hypothetical protein AOBTE_LOCUS11006 [Acanthoscelides obtectus]
MIRHIKQLSVHTYEFEGAYMFTLHCLSRKLRSFRACLRFIWVSIINTYQSDSLVS